MDGECCRILLKHLDNAREFDSSLCFFYNFCIFRVLCKGSFFFDSFISLHQQALIYRLLVLLMAYLSIQKRQKNAS
jgi:hypothetical protein